MKFNFKLNARFFIFTLVILTLVLVILFQSNLFFTKTPLLYIALVNSMNEGFKEAGEAVFKGVQLYLDEINQAGGINGKPVKLLVYDDQGDENRAKQIALDIVAQNKALIVLGHYSSNACIKAGKVYQEAHIPAITTFGSADTITAGNDWYFRTNASSKLYGIYDANYIKTILKQNQVGIVYDQQAAYSKPLIDSFKDTFIGLGGKIVHQWIVDSSADSINEQIENIAKELLQQHDQSLILMALYDSEAKQLIASIRRKGLQYPIFAGGGILNTNFNEYPEEQFKPGYFLKNVYGSYPIILDIASETTQKVGERFTNRYHHEFSTLAALAYEAAQVAIEAMQQTQVQGRTEDIAKERKKIRDYLATRTSMERTISGINMPFYFDKQGNALKPPAIGVFENQQFVSALTQFQPISNIERISNLEQELAAEHIITVGGQYMYKTNIVYTGIHFNEISNIDAKNSEYEVDFYLWFRYKRGIEATHIEFLNSVNKLHLGKPIAEKILPNDVVYRAYRVTGTFTEAFNFRNYPFDTQELSVKFKHAQLTRNNIIYVIDFVGMNKHNDNEILGSITSWQVNSSHFFQDTIKYNTSLGDPNLFSTNHSIEYSRFNAIIEMKRDVVSFIAKNLLPLLFLLGLSYFTLFLPLQEVSVTTISGILLAVAFFHLSLANGLPTGVGYAITLDYTFYIFYGLLIFQLLLVVIARHTLTIEGPEMVLNYLMVTGKVVYPLVFLIYVASLYHTYGDIKLSNFRFIPTSWVEPSASQEVIESNTTDSQVVLTFGAWQTVEIDKINRVLANFTAKYSHITIKFQPAVVSWYTPMLQFQLENRIAPDVFYLRSFSDSLPLFEAGYLEPLDKLPGLKNHFDLQSRQPWMSDNGEHYAVPFRAVSYGIYYNLDIFKQLNLAIPTTWEELLTIAQTIKAAGYIPFANGIQTAWATSELIFMNLAPNFIGGHAGRLQYDKGQRCFNDETVVATFQAIANLVPYLPPTPEDISYEESQQLFQQGKAAMLVDQSLSITTFETAQTDFEWSIFAVPAPAGQPRYLIYHPDFGIGLNAASKHMKEAKLFLEWLTQPETGELFSNELPGFFPMHNQAPSVRNPSATTFIALQKGRKTDVLWAFPKLMDGLPSGEYLMQKNTEAVIMGRKTPKQAADALQDGLAQWFNPAQKCLQFTHHSNDG